MIAEGPAAKRPPHMAFAPCCVEPALPSLSRLSFKIAIPALASVLLLTGGCDRQSGGNSQPSQGGSGGIAPAGDLTGKVDRSHAGAQMPALAFRDPAGKELQLASLKGRPLLVNLWATWCAPCVAELPTLDALAGGTGAPKVLTVSEDIGEPGKVAEFLKGKGLARLEPWLDPENAATVQYQINTLPVTIFYGADGHEKWRIAGGHDWNSAATAKLLAE
ncbi:MAG: TlpA family protein disulfide reductase [Sphingomonadales bacterium]|nr:TlpA family protein disulfide reductase [Sphingomonadales bacterium]